MKQPVPQAAIVGLVRHGVGLKDAHRLLSAAAEDSRRCLVVVPLPGPPRPGDRLRVRRSGDAIEVLEVAVAGAAWAIVGEPVPVSAADDLLLPPGLTGPLL